MTRESFVSREYHPERTSDERAETGRPEVTEASKPRLCFVVDAHWEARMGGAQYQVKGLLELLKRRADFALHYLARVTPAEGERDGYHLLRFGSDHDAGRLRMLMDAPSLYRRLRMLRPNIVYQRCLLPFTGVCAWYCRRHGAKFVFHIAHDRDVAKPARRPPGLHGALHAVSRAIAEFGMRRADVIVAQTDHQARTLRDEYGLEATLVIPNFLPAPAEPEHARDTRRARVIWVANFKPFKNPDLFVDLAEALAHRSDAEFVMAGRPGPSERYADLHARMANLPNLSYLGELSVERINEEIAASDIFVNTSSSEGFPNTYIQAWLRGVPVVSCFVDPDACLSQGGAGTLVGDPARLPQVVSALLDDRRRLSELGQAARRYALARHTPETAAPLLDLLMTMSASTGEASKRA